MIPVAKLGGPEPTSWMGEGDDEIDDAVENAIYFAYETDDAVENFVAFIRPANEGGEMPVRHYYHDETFSPSSSSSIRFADYLESSIESFFADFLPNI